MPDPVIRVSAALLGAVFAWAGVMKLFRWDAWRSGLQRYGLGAFEWAAAVVVPSLELLVVVGLATGYSRASAALTLALLGSFSLAVLRARSEEGDRLPCNCFGSDARRDYRTMLLRNVLLGIPAALILLGGEDSSLFGDARFPDASEALAAGLVGIGVLLVGWMVRVVATMADGDKR
jgi:uncharacterized membrane protein YphA (DoxX/SURF4 family)